MLKVGIVGLGTISYIHKIGIEESAHGQLVAVCDINEKTKQDYSDYPFYTDLEEMLQKADLDVVHVCLPHDLHVPATELILKYDVHAFLEKPPALTYEQGQRLIQAEKDSKGIIGVCFQNRYNKTSMKLMELLNDPDNKEKYGEINAVKAIVTWFRPESYYQAEPWRGKMAEAGGGTIINQSIHTLDLMRLFGGKVVDLKAQLSNLLDYEIEVEDTAVAHMNFEKDVNGFFMATNAHSVNSPIELQVLTEKARFTIHGTKLFYRQPVNSDPVLVVEDDQLESIKSYYGQGHKLAMEVFYDAILNGSDHYVHIEDALETTRLVDMMIQSSATGKRMINKGE